MFIRKGGRRLPLGHKPRGHQRAQPRSAQVAEAGAQARTLNGPTAQQSVLGTQTATTPGVFSSAAGGAGYRTLQAPPLARAPVQPTSFGFFAPFAQSGVPMERTRAAVPFAAPQPSGVMPAPVPPPPAKSSAQTAGVPSRSSVFPAPR